MSSTNQKNQSFDILINKTNNSKLSNQKSFFEKDFNNFQNMKVDDSIFIFVIAYLIYMWAYH